VRAEPFGADVSDTREVRQLAEAVLARFGRVDILVNNAGGFVRRTLLWKPTTELIDQVFHLNARSMIALCREIVPAMRERGSGTIINLTSISARNGGSIGAGLYSSTKAYVSTFTRSLAKELVKDGIRVNAVAPGVIDTPIHHGHTSPEVLEQLRATIRWAASADRRSAWGAVLFLASEELASFVTGAGHRGERRRGPAIGAMDAACCAYADSRCLRGPNKLARTAGRASTQIGSRLSRSHRQRKHRPRVGAGSSHRGSMLALRVGSSIEARTSARSSSGSECERTWPLAGPKTSTGRARHGGQAQQA
jgi:3-oxoacyl-[acyl-carrier protein] reductase